MAEAVIDVDDDGKAKDVSSRYHGMQLRTHHWRDCKKSAYDLNNPTYKFT
jgi:hypothetical protein